MDLVLGIAMTSRAIRWVLVEGTTGEGNPIDRGAIAFDEVDGVAAYDPNGLLRGLVDDSEIAADNFIHAIGVTWTSDAAQLADSVLAALEERGHANVVAVSEVEAASVLTSGIAEIAGYDEIAVCVIESDAAVAVTATSDAVSADRIERLLEDPGATVLIDNIKAVLESAAGGHTDAIFVLGSESDDEMVSALSTVATVPVITAAEADLAYARGAALTAALAVNAHDGQAGETKRIHVTKVGALSSVLAGAVVTLVVATSAAVGIQLHPGAFAPSVKDATVSEPATKPAPAAKLVPAPKAVPKPAPAAPPPAAPPPAAPAAPPPAAPPPPQTRPAPVAAVAVEPAPAYVPPAPAAPAPEPAYVPPPPPAAYVPPPAPPPVTYPQPRLRDRILERIPIINRFHEPKPWG